MDRGQLCDGERRGEVAELREIRAASDADVPDGVTAGATAPPEDLAARGRIAGTAEVVDEVEESEKVPRISRAQFRPVEAQGRSRLHI